MSYALIPEGYTLKKVTKAQKDAVNDLKRHEDVVTILNNPEIITIVAGIVTGAFLAKAISEIDLPDVPNWEEIKPKIIEKSKQASFAISPFGLPFYAAKKGSELAGGGKEFDKAVKIIEQTLKNAKPKVYSFTNLNVLISDLIDRGDLLPLSLKKVTRTEPILKKVNFDRKK